MRAPRKAAGPRPKRSWREALSGVAIDPSDRRANELEYEYTHGYPAPSGTWAVPLDWIPQKLTVLGPIRWIEYVSRKKFEGPRTFIFNHKHRLSNLPRIAEGVNSYGERAFAVLGGGYTITAHGIEDDPRDTREVPPGDSWVPRLLPKRLVGMGKMYALGYGRDSALDLSGAGLVLAYVREPKAQLYIVPGSLERRR